MNEIKLIKTDEIIPDDKEINNDNVDLLINSIAAEGLINPITIRPDKTIVAGRHRLEAFKRLNIKEIPCSITTSKDPEIIRIHENTMRSTLPLKRKLADAEYLIEKYGTRSGRPSQNTSNHDDKISPKSDELPDDTETLLKNNGLFSGRNRFYQAKKIAKECIQEVIENIDNGALSISFVYEHIVRKEIPKDKQKSYLYKLGNAAEAEIDKKTLNMEVHRRRAERRKKRFKVPSSPAKEQIYSYVRIAPDWSKEFVEDIQDLPVDDYLRDNGWLEIECPADSLADAVRIVDAWGYEFKNVYTIWNSKDKAHCNLPYIDSVCWHVVIAKKPGDGNPANLGSIQPVFDRKNPAESCIEIFESLLAKKDTQRLDMSGTVPRTGWKIWKLDYATKEK